MLDNAVQMLTQGVTFLGGVLVVFGLINLGMTIKDGICLLYTSDAADE